MEAQLITHYRLFPTGGVAVPLAAVNSGRSLRENIQHT